MSIIICPFCGSTYIQPSPGMPTGYFECLNCEREFYTRPTKVQRNKYCTHKVKYTVGFTKDGKIDKRQLTHNRNERKNYESADYSWSRKLEDR